MTKSPSSKAVDSVIQGKVKSFLKSEEFRKLGRTFHRPNGEVIQVVNFQTSWLNTPALAEFTVNLNVVLPFFHEMWTGRPLPRNPGSAAEICSFRLGQLLPEKTDKWWTVTPSTDCAFLSCEIAEIIRSVGLPLLAKTSDLQYLCEKLSSDKHVPGVLYNQSLTCAILLCYLGRINEARNILNEARRKKHHFSGYYELINVIEERLEGRK